MNMHATGTGEAHPFIIPLTKIDVQRRLVIGTAAEEIADKAREIMDYATAKPQFEAWSNSFSEATGGLSKGNLRVMHTKTVAGRLDAISYDDATKRVQIVAKVSDDNEWQKCLDGAYTGFSIGGGYLKKWNDPDTGMTRYTPIVREISLVDNPCMPTARFAELVKADGIVEQLELHGVTHTFADLWGERPALFNDLVKARPPLFDELRKATRIVGLSRSGKIAAGVVGAAVVGAGAAYAGKRIQRKLDQTYAGDTGEHVEQPFQHAIRHGSAATMGAIGAASAAHLVARLATGSRHAKIAAAAAVPIGAALGYASSRRQQIENAGHVPGHAIRVAARAGDVLRGGAPGAIGGAVGSALAGETPGVPTGFASSLGSFIGGRFGSAAATQRTNTRAAQRGYRKEVIGINGEHRGGQLSEAEHAQRVAAAKARWKKVAGGTKDPYKAAREIA